MKLPRELVIARRSVFALFAFLLLSLVFNTHLPALGELKPVPFRFLIELVCVVLFFSIFIVSWNAYSIHRQSRSVVLAIGFLCVAIFSFFNITSAIPSFTSSSYQQATLLFSFLWRITAAIILLLVAIERISSDLSKRHSRWVLEASLCGVALFSFLVFVYFDRIPPLDQVNTWSYAVRQGLEGLLIALFLVSGAIFYHQTKIAQAHADRVEKSFLFAACTVLAMSEFCLSNFHQTNELLITIGQLYKFIAALSLYFSIVTVSIRVPFNQLTVARLEVQKNRSRLTGIIQTATDGIITIDSQHRIVLVNAAAEGFFGYEPEQMIGMNLNQCIPMHHRKGHAQHVDQFGKTGVSIRQMGIKSADFSVTGLKKNGQEFPIEASISSLVEDGERFYTVIFRDITDRKLAKEKMDQYHQELSNLSQSLQTVREEERKHIARELHDDLGQLLAALRMDLTVLEKRIPDNTAAQPIFQSMDKLLLNSISTLRRIATDLRPRALDEGGLFFALLSLQKEFNQRHQIECELSAVEGELILNDQISTTIYRVIQESLTNVVRHAQATKVQICLSQAEGQVHFKIQDNGRGIAQEDFRKRQSFGLVGMRERVRALQGELTITGDEHGTSIEVSIPTEPIK